MSRICNILGLAVLGIALLVGAAAAADVEIGGCVIPTGYFHLNTTGLESNIQLGILHENTTLDINGGSLGVVAAAVYDLSVTSSPVSGKMSTADAVPLTLSYILHVKADTVDKGGVSGTAVKLVESGLANTDCDDQVTAVAYAQPIGEADYGAGRGGNYAIALTFAVGAHSP